MARTQEEILARIQNLEGSVGDFFGFQRSDLMTYLTFENAQSFLLEDVKAEDWTDKVADDATIIREIVDYLPFAWGKANNQRGLSAGRSINHMQAWLWMLGEEEAARRIEDYSAYGKPQLRAISEAFGFDWKAHDDGEWDHGAPSWPVLDIGLTRSFK